MVLRWLRKLVRRQGGLRGTRSAARRRCCSVRLGVESLEERGLLSVTAISLAAPGMPSLTPDGNSHVRSMSADGRYIAFESDAPNLVSGQRDYNGGNDVFLYDRVLARTTLVSHIPGSGTTAGYDISEKPVISADGNYIVFQSRAANLVPGQFESNGVEDVFLYDRVQGTIVMVSHSSGLGAWTANGRSDGAVISGDGRFVAYVSTATNLVGGVMDLNNATDVFLYDRLAGSSKLVSEGKDGTGFPFTANGASYGPVISASGLSVAYVSNATNLETPMNHLDRNGARPDVIRYDQWKQWDGRLVGFSNYVTRGNDSSINPVISADGRWIAFQSLATDLVAGQIDTNRAFDVFLVKDTAVVLTTLVSHTNNSAVTTPAVGSFGQVISADGRYVAFQSAALNLAAGVFDQNGDYDVFRFDRTTGVIALVSHSVVSSTRASVSASLAPVISADGRFVVFTSMATDLYTGRGVRSAWNVYVYDGLTGAIKLVNVLPASSVYPNGNQPSASPVISADGKFIAFDSLASDLVANDRNRKWDVFGFVNPIFNPVTLVPPLPSTFNPRFGVVD